MQQDAFYVSAPIKKCAMAARRGKQGAAMAMQLIF
jgi:hypothetical protein